MKSLQRQWDRFGRKDPLWAVLSLPEKRHGRWNEQEFFETGRCEIEDVLRRAGDLGSMPPRERALDFGCGVGRLTQALAGVFDGCDGVDIAPSMIALAEKYNRFPDRCRYHLNDQADLRLFADASFSFVYSNLVLQHMPSELSRIFVAEFLRVLAPGGLLVFHIPAEPFPEAAQASRRTVSGQPLPASAFRAEIRVAEPPSGAPAGAPLTLKATVRNRSGSLWPSLGSPAPMHQITLGNHWLDKFGSVVTVSDGRSPLPHDLAPDESVELFLRVVPPQPPADYVLELDLVQEGVAWFQQHDSPTLRLPFDSQGQRPARAAAAAPAPAPGDQPFRLRHPRAYQLVQALGLKSALRDGKRAAQRAAWRARSLRQTLTEKARRALDPPMQMNGIARDTVLSLIAAHGGRVVDVEAAELTHAGWQAFRYWVTR